MRSDIPSAWVEHIPNHEFTLPLEALMQERPGEDNEATITRQPIREAVSDCLDEMTEEERYILLSSAAEDLSTRQIGERIGLSKSQIARKLNAIQARLKLLLECHPLVQEKLGMHDPVKLAYWHIIREPAAFLLDDPLLLTSTQKGWDKVWDLHQELLDLAVAAREDMKKREWWDPNTVWDHYENWAWAAKTSAFQASVLAIRAVHEYLNGPSWTKPTAASERTALNDIIACALTAHEKGNQ